jgi:hypothetical protein
LYDELTVRRGFASRCCLLGRSRGGLWNSSWAIHNPEKVAGMAGIYPVFLLGKRTGLVTLAACAGLLANLALVFAAGALGPERYALGQTVSFLMVLAITGWVGLRSLAVRPNLREIGVIVMAVAVMAAVVWPLSGRFQRTGVGHGGDQAVRAFDGHITVGRQVGRPVQHVGDQPHVLAGRNQVFPIGIPAHAGQKGRPQAKAPQGRRDVQRHPAGQARDPPGHVRAQGHLGPGPSSPRDTSMAARRPDALAGLLDELPGSLHLWPAGKGARIQRNLGLPRSRRRPRRRRCSPAAR